ncbi:hypothetical protein OHB06_02020 [Streptomyces sp. NBC_01604]|uniref:hypothetical protein n=1 Tax=Streptomyces sp. NBC_01604 TaxID=2975894 RepID=UPI003864F627
MQAPIMFWVRSMLRDMMDIYSHHPWSFPSFDRAVTSNGAVRSYWCCAHAAQRVARLTSVGAQQPVRCAVFGPDGLRML